jgi:hypothetical protein
METIIEKYNNLQKEILSDFSLKWDGENCEITFRDDVKKLYSGEKPPSKIVYCNSDVVHSINQANLDYSQSKVACENKEYLDNFIRRN